MIPSGLNFGAAWWLWGLTAIPVLALLFRWAERKAAQRLAALLPAPRLRARLTGTASAARRRWRYILLLLALSGLVVALAEPRWGDETWESHRRGLDVIAVVDVSKSMLATDVAPSRLIRAKLVLHDLATQLQGDRLGLVAFAGSAFLQAPLTIDYDAVLRAVDELDTNLIPMGGTNIGGGLNLAVEAFGKAEAGNRAVLLLSDGEPTSESDQADGIRAATRAAEAGVKVFALGFGTPEGSLIPLEGGELVRDEHGQLVRTRLNENGLKEIAQAGGGFYVRFENGDAALRTIIQDGLSRLKIAEIEARISRRPIERYQWPLGFALAALSLAWLLGERRLAPASAASPGVGVGAGSAGTRRSPALAPVWVAFGLCAGLAGAAAPAGAAEPGNPTSTALDLYQAGKYNEAYDAFEELAKQHPQVGNLQFNAGASAYMAKQYEEALDAFGKALASADPSLQAKSQYNFGNALFRRGEQQKARQEKINDWRNALQHYDTALNALKAKQPPPQADKALASNTTYNRDLVQRRLDEELKQPPPQQDQDKQNQPKSPDPRQQSPGGQQNKLDQQQRQQQSATEGPPHPRDQGKPNQQSQPDSPQGTPSGNQPQPGQPGQRPDPSSVPNQDKPRQRGDFKAQPGDHPGETPKDQNQPPSPDDAGGEKGKMSPDQARTLLQSLKDEDTTVNLNDDAERRRDEPVLKDW